LGLGAGETPDDRNELPDPFGIDGFELFIHPSPVGVGTKGFAREADKGRG
jgi:hypothetical protein